MNERAHPRQLFAYPFRVFFLSAGLLAVLAVGMWMLMLTSGAQLPLALAPLDWHQHEMLFGWLHAAIAGFLLTAVCVWTGTDRLHGVRLAMLWGVWLAGRVLMLGGAALPAWLVHGVDLAFLPLVMLDAGLRIWHARQRRQWVLMVVLGLLWAMELGFHIAPRGPFAHGALIMAMTLMLVIGGRITPAFTGNWLRLRGEDPSAVRSVTALEIATPVSMFLLLALVLLGAAPALMAAAALFAAVVSGTRLVLWRPWRVRAEPLLWILHLSLAFVPLALVLLAAAALGRVPASAWVHAAGAGAMGGLILGVMSWVALGHTGRPLRLPAAMRWAFIVVLLAGAARVLTALNLLPAMPGLAGTTALWLLAFGLFVLRYWRILAAPRVDGKPG